MFTRFSAIALSIGLVLLTGCSAEYSDADLQLVSVLEAETVIKQSTSSLFSEAKPNAWIDPRTIEAYSTGHIPGAISMPYRDIAISWEKLEAYDLVIVYGRTYNDPIADAMSKSLMEYGLKDVKTLRGGLEAWVNAGNPVTKGRNP